jgi:hypothetical protein
VLLSGCRPSVRSIQPLTEQEYPLQAGANIGQSFVARFDGLEGVQFFLRPQTPGGGEVVLHLREDPNSTEDLRSSSIPFESLTIPNYYSFNFAPLSSSQGIYFYAFIEIEGDGDALLYGTEGEAYTEGALYADHTPLDAQAAFRLSYSPIWLAAGLVKLAFSWGAILLAGLVLFLIPGWALLSRLSPHGLDWMSKAALSTGLSLAVYPLLLLWTDFFGLHLGAWTAWLPPLAGAAVLAVPRLRSLKISGSLFPKNGSEPPLHKTNQVNLTQQLVIVVILALLFITRFWPVRLLEAPMWGDSVQHTIMTQLILDNGGLFESWLPYAQYESMTVQYGFSAAAAVFSWLTGFSSLKSVIWVGQLINIIAVLALYPLAVRVSGGRRWAGIAAIAAAGLLSPIPAEYVNWGRYAQLAGLAVLPAALWLLWEVLERAAPDNVQPAPEIRARTRPSGTRRAALDLPWKTIAIAGLALAGMTLVYFRTPFFYASFAAVLLLAWAAPNWRLDLKRWLRGLVSAGFTGAGAVLLCLPWGVRVMGGQLAETFGAGLEAGSALDAVLVDYQTWSYLFDHLPAWLAAAAATAAVWSLIKRQWVPASLSLWSLALFSLVALALLRIPGANMMQNFAVIISMYIPTALLVGWLFDWATGATALRSSTGQATAAVFLIAVALWGAWGQRAVVRPGEYAMVTRPDLRAMDWIPQNLPENSRFLVEGFTIYDGYSAVGSDAGWWLPLVSGRENTMPPQYALMNERPFQPDYTSRIVELVAHLEKHSLNTSDGRSQLCDLSITHVYIGQAQGRVSASRYQLFDPQDLLDDPFFEQVYHQDRVYIFAHDLESCEIPGG